MSDPKKYTIWLDYGLEGWKPNDFDTLPECLDLMLSYAHGGDYRITRPVAVDIIERPAPATTDPLTLAKEIMKNANWAPSPGNNTGHGHVYLRPDGVRARCGGPGLCTDCAIELARLMREGAN